MFLSVETKDNAQGVNAYTYVRENPETMTDPTGERYTGSGGGSGGPNKNDCAGNPYQNGCFYGPPSPYACSQNPSLYGCPTPTPKPKPAKPTNPCPGHSECVTKAKNVPVPTGGAVLTPSPLHGSHTYIGNKGLDLLLGTLDDLSQWLIDNLSTLSFSQLSALLYAVAGFVGNIAAAPPLGPIHFVLAAVGVAAFVTSNIPDSSGGKGQLNSVATIHSFIFDLKEQVRSLEGSWAKNRAFVFYEADTYGREATSVPTIHGPMFIYRTVLTGVAFHVYSYAIPGADDSN